MDDVQPGSELAGANAAAGQAQAPAYEEIAQIIDYPLLGAAITEEQVHHGCLTARAYGMAAVVVRPSDVDLVLRWMEHSVVKVASVAGYPFGFTTTAAKLYEARDLLRRGVKQIDCSLNAGKMISRQFQYCELELVQMRQSCDESRATLKVMIDADQMNEEMKIIGCRMAKRVQAGYAAITAPRDIELMVTHTGIKVKAQVGAVRTLDELLALRAAGIAHFRSAAAVEILDAWKARLEARKASEAGVP